MSYKRPFTFRFDAVYYAKIQKIAERETRSMSNLIEHLCRKEIERYEAEHGVIPISDEDLAEK